MDLNCFFSSLTHMILSDTKFTIQDGRMLYEFNMFYYMLNDAPVAFFIIQNLI